MKKWKRELQAVADNPDFIEMNIVAVNKELKKERPDTEYLRRKIENMKEWTYEIELAEKRAREKKLKKVI